MMKQRKTIRLTFLILSLLCSGSGLFAQQGFKYKAQLPQVDSASFYKITLSPGIIARCNATLSDIRILNQNGDATPYLFGSELPLKNEPNFIAFTRIDESQNDTVTTFITKNDLNLSLNQLSLRLRNTAVQRQVNLSGSDDLKKWYAVKENLVLNKATEDSSNAGVYEQIINFPSSTYKYFKLAINNGRRDPINIIQAGVYRAQRTKPVYISLPPASFSQKDSTGLSKLRITFNNSYQINKLQLTITGTKYYKRGVSVYKIIGNKRWLVADTILSSVDSGYLYVPAKTSELELVIDNQDNLPLKVKAMNAFGLEQSLIAYLTNGHNYSLGFGNTEALSPNYDLKFFADSVQNNLSVLTPGNITDNASYNHTTQNKPYSIPAWAIWVSIVVAAFALSALTYKMVTEIDKRKT